ncbi:hypothetical protein AB833_13295 [Chromatiales bacterium (ex Bugula neritina AB1)]|nr:hypothetical protein AB833_13295 [Chromatiales bacterium (ex Bugula neritina AB1)]
MEKLLLLVDDEPQILKSLRRLFHNTDYTILATTCAIEALEIIREQPVSVLISDYSMPSITGAELLSRAQTLRPDMYTIILSGNSDQEAVLRSVNDGGASKFINKPWDSEALRTLVDDAYRDWSKAHYVLETPQVLNQASFVSQLASQVKNDVNCIVVYFHLPDILNPQGTLDIGEKRELLRTFLTHRTNEPWLLITFGVTDEGRLCAFLTTPDSQSVQTTVDRLYNSLPDSIKFNGYQLPVRCDIGYSVSDNSYIDACELINNAIMALQHATVTNMSGPIAFKQQFRIKHTEQQLLNHRLQQALVNDELEIFYQPKISLETHSICGAEALMRWTNPQLGSVSPAVFIPLAEKNGLINELGNWVMCQTALQWTQLQINSINDCRISINVSPVQLKDPKFKSRLISVLTSSGISPSLFEIELTESTALQDFDRTLYLLSEIHELGVMISIDDFGTGYSSLNYLSTLPVDIMKIDRSFISPIPENRVSLRLAQNLIRIGHDLGLEVVAEGVENAAQLTALSEAGCDVIQGYYFSKPLPLDGFRNFTAQFDTSDAAIELATGKSRLHRLAG